MYTHTNTFVTALLLATPAIAEPPDFADGIIIREPEFIPLVEIDEPFAYIESESMILESDDFGQSWNETADASGYANLPLELRLNDEQTRSFNGITITHNASLNARSDCWPTRDGFRMMSKSSLWNTSSWELNEDEHDPFGFIIDEGIASGYSWQYLELDVRANRDVVVEFSGYGTPGHELMVHSEGSMTSAPQEKNGMYESRIYLPAGEHRFHQEVQNVQGWSAGIVSCAFTEHVPGDMNLDGYMDFDDILYFYYQLLGSDERVSDLDDDGDTDQEDWLLILEIWRG